MWASRNMGVPRGGAHSTTSAWPPTPVCPNTFPCCATTSVLLPTPRANREAQAFFYPSLVAPRISFDLAYATLSDKNVLMTPQFLSSATLLSLPPRICVSQHPPGALNLIARPAAWTDHTFHQREDSCLPSALLLPNKDPTLVPDSTVNTIPPRSIFIARPTHLVKVD